MPQETSQNFLYNSNVNLQILAGYYFKTLDVIIKQESRYLCNKACILTHKV